MQKTPKAALVSLNSNAAFFIFQKILGTRLSAIGTTWNHLERAPAQWNHLEQPLWAPGTVLPSKGSQRGLGTTWNARSAFGTLGTTWNAL